MAEYYPLLAKAIGSLPNSTPESRRVVYERARKALIGQLRTLHPPVPDEDIERESVELDRAVERLETELANGAAPPVRAPEAPPSDSPPPKAPSAKPPLSKPPSSKPPSTNKPLAPKPLTPKPLTPKPASSPLKPLQPKPPAPAAEDGASAPAVPQPSSLTPAPRPKPPTLPERKPLTPRTPIVSKPAAPSVQQTPPDKSAAPPVPPSLAIDQPAVPSTRQVEADADARRGPADAWARGAGAADPLAPSVQDGPTDGSRRLKPPRRPIAPQPAGTRAPRRALWLIPTVVVVVVAIVAAAAWKLRDRPATLARKPAEQTQADSSKIAERVGGSTSAPSQTDEKPDEQTKPATAAPATANQAPAKPSANPEVPVARRAALLVEAPDEPNKVKTFVGNVVWKLNNAPQGANAAVGLAVEADVDLPDDKLKVTVIFEKNSEASLPASHTIKIRFAAEPGSFTGNVKQISVPQMRPEASPNGEPLAGVTVQIVPNSFLVGLSPGNAEAANTDLMRRLQWVDIPILLDNGKIAKLTFEKGESGQRDLNEAFEAWQK